jgi:hypothetical protein
VASKAGGEFVKLLHPFSAALAFDRAAKPPGWTGSISNKPAVCLAWWYVSAAARATSRYSPTKRTAMSLEDSWVACGHGCSPLLVGMDVCPAITGNGCEAGPGEGVALADSGRQSVETDRRALRAIVAVDLQGRTTGG